MFYFRAILMKMNYKERLQLLHERLEHINTPDLSELDEAMEKVECFDGDYYVNKNTITNTELIEILDK